MHGLIGKALECFLADAHGLAVRDAALAAAGRRNGGFRSTWRYPPDTLRRALLTTASRTGLPVEALLVDLGIWLVSRPKTEALRRLVRFGGADYRGLLHSLEDLPARGRLAVPGLILPGIVLMDRNPAYELRTEFAEPGAGWVLTGVLRAMADDHGVLAVVEHVGTRRIPGGHEERLRVEVADEAHATGRRFDLAPEKPIRPGHDIWRVSPPPPAGAGTGAVGPTDSAPAATRSDPEEPCPWPTAA